MLKYSPLEEGNASGIDQIPAHLVKVYNHIENRQQLKIVRAKPSQQEEPTMNNQEKLAVIALGNSNSGKSMTWNTLFGRTVKTGANARELVIKNNLFTEIFLVSGSPEERKKYVGEIVVDINIRIILCSMQYTRDCVSTIDFFYKNNYQFYVHWLNPGYSDESEYQDKEDIIATLNGYNAVIEKHNGKINPNSRVETIRNYIYNWASRQAIIHSI